MNKYIKLFFVYPTNLDDLKKVEHVGLWSLFLAFLVTTLWLLFVYVDKPNANSTFNLFSLNIVISLNIITYAIFTFDVFQRIKKNAEAKEISLSRKLKLDLYKKYFYLVFIPMIFIVTWFVSNKEFESAFTILGIFIFGVTGVYFFDWRKFERLHKSLSNS